MNVRRIMTSLSMILRMLFRRRIVLILLVVIPIVFFSVVAITTSIQKVPFRIASMNGKVFILASEKHMALVFFAVAIAGFLMSFLAMNLIQKNSTINRRLMVCGYHPPRTAIIEPSGINLDDPDDLGIRWITHGCIFPRFSSRNDDIQPCPHRLCLWRLWFGGWQFDRRGA